VALFRDSTKNGFAKGEIRKLGQLVLSLCQSPAHANARGRTKAVS
jgi:hypothetical protein